MDELSRKQLHDLVDKLPLPHIDAVLAFAHVLNMDPVARAVLFAPYDDEPFADADAKRIEHSLADPRPDVSFEEMREELGL